MGTFAIFVCRLIRMERIIAKSTLRTYWENNPKLNSTLKHGMIQQCRLIGRRPMM